jgi:short-subunit dehydrogenase
MNNRIIVIIGASRGIGKALVDILSKDPENLILALSRDWERMNDVFHAKENVKSLSFDITKNVENQIRLLLNDYEKIDILINNAGYLVNKPFPSITHEDFLNCYQVNVIGVMETVQALLPKMEEKGAHIVNISSMGGVQGTVKFAGLTAYSTSKAALCSFTELFSEEFKNSTIKMNCLALGAAQTEMLEEAFPGYVAPLSAEKMAEYIADFALKGHTWFNGKIIPVSLSTP